MKIVQIGNRKLTFRNSFKELTVEQFCEFMHLAALIEQNEAETAQLEKELDQLKGDDIVDEVMFLEASLNEKDSKRRLMRIEQLSALTKDPKATRDYLLDTKGITSAIIIKLFAAVEKGFANFEEVFASIKPINKFRTSDYKRSSFFRLSKVREFEVFDMNRTTVLRDMVAGLVANQIDGVKNEFTLNRWDNLAKFLSFVCRPANELEEISATVKDAKFTFLGGKEVSKLNVEDRLKAYNDKLTKEAEKREPIFGKLPLVVAFGIYKQYFFLSKI